MRLILILALYWPLSEVFGQPQDTSPSFPEKNLNFEDTYEAYLNFAVAFGNQWRAFSNEDFKKTITKNQYEEMRQEFAEQYLRYQRILETHLKKIKVEFEWVELAQAKTKELASKDIALFIKPNQASPLNRLAEKLWTKYTVRMVYDAFAIQNAAPMGNAAYDPEINVLYLNFEAGQNRYPDTMQMVTAEHEIVHVESDAFRNGLTDSENDGGHGLHMRVGDRGERFSAEELIAHTVQISRMAALIPNESNPERAKEQKNIIVASQRISLRYAKSALNVIEFIETQRIVERNVFKVERYSTLDWVVFSDETEGFYLHLFLQKTEHKEFQKDPKKWVAAAINRLKAHAEFTVSVLTDESGKLSSDYERLAKYRQAHRDLVKKLRK